MNEHVFADSFSWIALVNTRDNYHKHVVELMTELFEKQTKLVTTNYVLLETINALSKSAHRKAVIELIRRIEISDNVAIIKISENIYQSAWKNYIRATDKEWGITDCTSFEIMKMFKITTAFTNDHHFEQAGFNILLRVEST